MPRVIARNPTAGEVERAAEVASIAFPNLPLEHWLKSFHTVAELFGEQFILVVELDGKIVSSLLCTPGDVYINEQPVSHSAVGAVGTLPEYRRRGCAGAMMTECVKLLKRNEIALSSLWPFSYEYYRKFGWEVGAERRFYNAKAEFFAALGDPKNARAATEGDFEDIKEVYDEFAFQFNGPTSRDDDWWSRIIEFESRLKTPMEPGKGVVVHLSEGVVDGYTEYKIEIKEDVKHIEAGEIVYNEPEHRRDMLALVASMYPESQMVFSAPADDLFLHEIPDPCAVQTSVRPSFQFRVIDPQLAMESLAVSEFAEGKLTLSINDPVFKHGFEFGVEFEDGEIGLCKPDRRNLISMDVQTLAKLYSGYLSMDRAWRLGKVSVLGIETIPVAIRLFSLLEPFRSLLEPG